MSCFVLGTTLTRALFDAEPEEVKNKVELYRKKVASSFAIKLEDDNGEEEAVDEASKDERNRQMQA
jgi:hypothetical protein